MNRQRPTNETGLEILLRRATDDSDLRPKFCPTLLASEIYILVPRRPDRTSFVPTGSELPVIEWFRPDGVCMDPVPYVALRYRDTMISFIARHDTSFRNRKVRS